MCEEKRSGNTGGGDFAAVIMAAGYSSRMKSFKPLLEVGGETAVERLMRAAKEAGIHRLVVVTGHERQKLSFLFERRKPERGKTPEGEEQAPAEDGAERAGGSALCMEAYNRDFPEGMFSSIKKGLSTVMERWPQTKGVFIMPVDCPLVSSRVMRALMEADAAGKGEDDGNAPEQFKVPVFRGKKGHPLLVPSSYIDEICSYDGPGGLKAVTDRNMDLMRRIPVDEEGCVMDMDTPQAYREIEEFLASGCKRKPLAELSRGRRIFLVRHGQTRQHDEKMFIGRYDVPLAADAEEDIRKTAEELRYILAVSQVSEGNDGEAKKDDAKAPFCIYTSPLARARQTAEIIKDAMGKSAEIRIVDDFTEISLGSWDGRPIREIRERYPEEYKRRGKDIFSFKIGNGSENFYDVQYRAVKALRKILEADASQDIIIVAHSAVIRSLENNLKNMSVDDCWEEIPKGGFVEVHYR